MTDAEQVKVLQGRVNALEGLIATFIGVLLSMVGNDPDKTKTIALLDMAREAAMGIEADREEGCQPETARAVDEVLSQISENLGLLRPNDR